MVESFVVNTLISLGVDVISLGFSTTPTVAVAVPKKKANGGVIITASHNSEQWNALKLLNEKGEFINANEGEKLIEFVEKNTTIEYATIDEIGAVTHIEDGYINAHIDEVVNLDTADIVAIEKAHFKVVVDAVNSTGGIAVPKLLERIGVETIKLYCEPNGIFPHNPEPLDAHLKDIKQKVVQEKADLGIVVDPDVDRLVFVCEDGTLFGEEYTLVACADYILGLKNGNTVSNLSSTRALRDVCEKHGQKCFYTSVGEVNVVEAMKKNHAVIGGEGNGGVILPDLHYGRDALVGIILFLSHLAKKDMSVRALRDSYPNYIMHKSKIEIGDKADAIAILSALGSKYSNEKVNTQDGLKIDFPNSWVHIRLSNTEPILRIYSEAHTKEKADDLANNIIRQIRGGLSHKRLI
ncbi:phosphoglucosamine mutase [Elysia marginata]|uniref:Phosphoglucosamine mutase n=1 Tax=Elysia marginata TaxID=1093978 RepID=A0AAV4H025_9GAST|nr:phosphoglucosamine mutase [Elysia marginata]